MILGQGQVARHRHDYIRQHGLEKNITMAADVRSKRNRSTKTSNRELEDRPNQLPMSTLRWSKWAGRNCNMKLRVRGLTQLTTTPLDVVASMKLARDANP